MMKPQQLQRFEDGKNWSMATTDRPHFAFVPELAHKFAPARVCYCFG